MLSEKNENLRVQLTELNNRSRWYSTQLWQLPFAYLGITGLTLASMENPSQVKIGIVSFAAAVFGVLVSVHTLGIRDGEKRAVRNLQAIESSLEGITPTAEIKWYTRPMIVATFGATIFYFLLGMYFLCVGAR